jgi:hypothetical protein
MNIWSIGMDGGQVDRADRGEDKQGMWTLGIFIGQVNIAEHGQRNDHWGH